MEINLFNDDDEVCGIAKLNTIYNMKWTKQGLPCLVKIKEVNEATKQILTEHQDDKGWSLSTNKVKFYKV